MNILVGAEHALLSLLVFLVGLILNVYLSGSFRIKLSRGIFLYFWHTLFSIVYLTYSLSDVVDSVNYYNNSINYEFQLMVGTNFVYAFTSIFSSALSFGYMGVFLVYNIIGAIGLLAFYASLLRCSSDKSLFVRRLVLLIVLLPSVSFWSSAIGKDSIAFMATGLALWSAIDLKHRSSVFVFSVLTMFLVRPHIAGVMVIAVSIHYVVSLDQSFLRRLFYIFVMSSVAIFMVPFAINYAGLSQVSVYEISQFVEARQSYNQDGGGGVDISSMSLPVQLFTYAFRPLPFEAGSLTQLAASLDNMLLLVLAMLGLWGVLNGRRFSQVPGWIFMLSFALGCWLILAVTTANLGIAVRQKWMFMPMLIVLLVSVSGRSRVPTFNCSPKLSSR